MRRLDLDYTAQIENTVRNLERTQEELEGIKVGLGVNIYCPSEFGEYWREAKERSGEVKTD